MLILVASHVFNSRNITHLNQALESILKNTKSPKAILLSISFETNDLEKEFSGLKMDDKVKVYIQPDRYLQFEHYNFIHKQGLIKDDDIVGFLDDDDIMMKNKIEVVSGYFEKDKDLEILRHECVQITTENNIKQDEGWCLSEYFCLNMKGVVFNNWFRQTEFYTDNSFESNLKQFGYITDLVFNISLESKHKSVSIPDILIVKVVALERYKK